MYVQIDPHCLRSLGHRNTILQETEIPFPSICRPTIKSVMFVRKYKDKQFVCGHNILTEGVIVTQLSSNAGIST